MHVRALWTDHLDGRLLALRAGGCTWDEAALALGLGRNTVVERGRRLGARKLPKQAPAIVLEPLDRPALPPGHPNSWGLLTAGTVLDGAAYPFPVFL